MLMLRPAVLLAAFGVSACALPAHLRAMMEGPAEPIYVLVKSDPEGATVSFPDGTICETPCRVGVIEPLEMTVARAGYAPFTRTIDRVTPSPLIIRLEAVGRSGVIEEGKLPDL